MFFFLWLLFWVFGIHVEFQRVKFSPSFSWNLQWYETDGDRDFSGAAALSDSVHEFLEVHDMGGLGLGWDTLLAKFFTWKWMVGRLTISFWGNFKSFWVVGDFGWKEVWICFGVFGVRTKTSVFFVPKDGWMRVERCWGWRKEPCKEQWSQKYGQVELYALSRLIILFKWTVTKTLFSCCIYWGWYHPIILGIIRSRYKDPYKPISIIKGLERCSNQDYYKKGHLT